MSRSYWATDPTGGAWFRVGRLDVTTTILTVAVGALGLISWVVSPPLVSLLAFVPEWALRGQVWRLFTWPLADSVSLWSILNLVMLWYFGRELEATLGRHRMAWLIGGIWAALTGATTVVSLLGPGAGLAGMGMVELAVLLLWIAEYPHRRFLFNIPAWVLGLFVVGLQVLTMLGMRSWPSLLSFVLGMALVAVVARRLGLLTTYPWIPGRARTARTTSPRPPARKRRENRRQESDSARMDHLLGKISAEGLHALSKSERAELERLRLRRR